MWVWVVCVCLAAAGGAQKLPSAPPQPIGPPGGPPEVPEGMTPPDQAMTTPDVDQSDMPQQLAAHALDVDFGKDFERVRFHYQNHQEMWEEPRPYGLIFRHNCLYQFLACMLAQSGPEVVCAFNSQNQKANGYWTAESYCHVFHDNCRRRFRVWRVLDTGACQFHKQGIGKDRDFFPNYNNHWGYQHAFVSEPNNGVWWNQWWPTHRTTDPELPSDWR